MLNIPNVTEAKRKTDEIRAREVAPIVEEAINKAINGGHYCCEIMGEVPMILSTELIEKGYEVRICTDAYDSRHTKIIW